MSKMPKTWDRPKKFTHANTDALWYGGIGSIFITMRESAYSDRYCQGWINFSQLERWYLAAKKARGKR